MPQPPEMSSTCTKDSGESDSVLFSCSRMVSVVIDIVSGGKEAWKAKKE